MSETKAVVPAIKQRELLLKEMTPSCRQLAKDIDKSLAAWSKGTVGTWYNIGVWIKDARDPKNEAHFGLKAVDQLAAFINESPALLYNLQNFVEVFPEKKFVLAYCDQPMANGRYLELGHWMRFMTIQNRAEQEKVIKRTLRESLSLRDLEAEIRASGTQRRNVRSGGRNPAIPTSPIAGLQKFWGLSNKMLNFEKIVEKHVCDQLDELAPAQINANLLNKLETTLDMVSSAREAMGNAVGRLTDNIKRVKKVLDSKPADEIQAVAEDNGEEAPRPHTAKASANGHVVKGDKTSVDKKPKKAKRRPVVAK